MTGADAGFGYLYGEFAEFKGHHDTLTRSLRAEEREPDFHGARVGIGELFRVLRHTVRW